MDKLDGLISNYCKKSRTKKWSLRDICNFVDIALANLWLEYRDVQIRNDNRKCYDLLSLRNEVANALLKAKLDPLFAKLTNFVGLP